MSDSISLFSIETFVFRAPLEQPVITSFGIMNDRPAVLVKISDATGRVGWGEVWCNFPACGAEHRVRLLETVLAPLIWGKTFERPEQVFDYLTEKTRVLAIQSGEAGPLAQVIAGIDIAVWDLVSRRENRPLYTMLSDRTVSDIPAYASGINAVSAIEEITKCREIYGYKAFKVKIGFGLERDLEVVNSVRESLQSDEVLMLDANQAWDVDSAIEVITGIENLALGWTPEWVEEPVRADSPNRDWQAIRDAINTPIAGGENLRGEDWFRDSIDNALFDVVQPDACKWGGISKCLNVARLALKSGLRYCPHYLGGGIGLMASAHILAAAGGDGMLEVDVNPNPLREILAQPFPDISAGRFTIPDAPGLGVEPDLGGAGSWLVSHQELLP